MQNKRLYAIIIFICCVFIFTEHHFANAESQDAIKDALKKEIKDEIKKELQEEKKQGEPKKEIWNSTILAGTQFLPDYSEEGKNNGLNKTRLNISLNLNSRWKTKKGLVLASGITVEMLGTGVVKKDSSSTTNMPTKFSDVSQTIDSNFYFVVVPKGILASGTGSELGVIGKAGIITRDTTAYDESTLNKYGAVGLQYVYYHEFDKKKGYINYPDGSLSIVKAWYNDYSGYSNARRTVIDAEYKLINDLPFFFGGHANIGKGADEFYLKLSAKIEVGKLLSIFGEENK
jgi:hypothetical protein